MKPRPVVKPECKYRFPQTDRVEKGKDIFDWIKCKGRVNYKFPIK